MDGEWVNELSPKTLIDAVIELQPLLTIVEADRVTRAVADMLGQSQGGELRGIGTDFSGRRWLTAKLTPALQPLAARTLGTGKADPSWLQAARADRAMFMWQGLLGGPGELARVQLPVPRQWLKEAKSPHLRLVLAWDSPANAAVEHLWASRKVTCQLRVRLDTKAIVGSRGGHKTYPILDRTYDLSRVPGGAEPADDLWLLELSYEQAAEYYPGQVFNPQQRIAFAAELYDESEQPLSPQSFLQALPIAASMTRFSASVNLVRTPVMVKTRL